MEPCPVLPNVFRIQKYLFVSLSEKFLKKNVFFEIFLRNFCLFSNNCDSKHKVRSLEKLLNTIMVISYTYKSFPKQKLFYVWLMFGMLAMKNETIQYFSELCFLST